MALLVLPGPAEGIQERETESRPPPFRVWGDLRLRGELDRDRRGAPDRERGRIRFRVAAEHQLAQGLTLGARLVTAPDEADPNSTHQNLGTGFRDFRVTLDRAYVRWTPTSRWPVQLLAGKFEPPFLSPPVFGELVWDADIQPEGAVAILEPVLGLRLVGGAYIFFHQGAGDDVNLGASQAAFRFEPVPRLQITAALAAYFYGTPDEGAARRLARDDQGNALVLDVDGDTVGFASRFEIWNGHLAAAYEGLPFPVTTALEYVVNASDAPGSDGDGLAIGMSLGGLGRPGRWRLDYQYQDLGREAIFSAVAQDDFLDSTNFRGHLLGLAVQYLPRAHAYLWTLWSARQQPRQGTFQKRIRLDLNFSWSLR